MPRDKTDKQTGKEVVARIQAIYAEWEGRALDRACTGRAECCCFGITGRTPYLTAGEALVAARAWKASGRKELPETSDGSCPFLEAGRCRIYSSRPFGCRTHFCDAAGGPAPRPMVRDLIHRLEEIDLQLGGRGGVKLAAAVSAAWEGARKG